MNFDDAFTRLLGHEGGYSNSAADPGGETMFGITKAVARASGYAGAMNALPRETAKSIYWAKYWSAVRADDLPDSVQFDAFDAAVNHGPVQSARWLQRAAGANDDGVIGPATMNAIGDAGPQLAARFNGQRLRFYTDLPTWTEFGKGWARRVASNLSASGA